MAIAEEAATAVEQARTCAEPDWPGEREPSWIDIEEEVRLARQRRRDALVASGVLALCDDRR